MKKYLFAGVAAAALLGLANIASAADVNNACLNANEPTGTGEEQKAFCSCITEAIGDNATLQEEAVSLAAMTAEARAEATSEELQAAITPCVPEAPAEAG